MSHIRSTGGEGLGLSRGWALPSTEENPQRNAAGLTEDATHRLRLGLEV